MDRKFFKGQMEILAGAYRDARYVSDITLKSWYEFFKTESQEHFAEAIRTWVALKSSPPTVADIKSECSEIKMKEAMNV